MSRVARAWPRPASRPVIGLVQWFRRGEKDRVEAVINDLRTLDVRHLRIGLSWADWCTSGGETWFNWLVPTLAEHAELLPCLHYTPPSLGIEPRSSAPPGDPAGYAAFVEFMIERFGRHCDAVELWNEPNNPAEWDSSLDPDSRLFAQMAAGAARGAHAHGMRTVLGGMCPIDPEWLDRLCDHGALKDIDAVGVHGFPGTWDFDWAEWPQSIAGVRRVLDAHGLSCEIWITETGYSTWRQDEPAQVRAFVTAQEAPVERLYWTSVLDLDPEQAHRDGLQAEERHYHMGLRPLNGPPKLLHQLWARGGVRGVCASAWLRARPVPALGAKPTLVTGGAGFIGCNVADRLLRAGERVVVLDNLSRAGVEQNLAWLQSCHGDRLQVEIGDIRDAVRLRRLVASARRVVHLAGQVAVTTSLRHALADFDVNARGTLTLLEALRAAPAPPPLVFTSTSKVYGDLQDLGLRLTAGRYEPEDPTLAARGIDERRPLRFHSPHGCSKGAADQYVLDYARTFGLPCTVLRTGSIYGPHQFGTEDQGWVAHFVLKSLAREPLVLYGDGRQMRDLLFVDDLVDALLAALAAINRTTGEAYNIGGGPTRAISLLELVDLLAELHCHRPDLEFAAWRPGDQRYYVSNTEKFEKATGWLPRTSLDAGLEQLNAWLAAARTGALPPPSPGARRLEVRAS
jgi:CDP-paratose 2-epimerase